MKLTKVRRAGLELLHPGPLRISNVTDPARGTLYWQTAEYLAAAGLAEKERRGFEDWISITDLGRAEVVS